MFATEWDSVSLAGAFLLGAVLATVAVLRVVRAVAILFEDGPRRRRHHYINKEEPCSRPLPKATPD